MAFLDRVLDPPSYGFERDGKLYVPTHREILREFFKRLNVFRDRKNWLPFLGWTASLFFPAPGPEVMALVYRRGGAKKEV